MAAGPGDADELSGPLCFEKVGDLDATFSVPFGGAGSADVTLEIDGASVPLSGMSAHAGPSEDVAGQSVLYLVAQKSDNRTVIAVVAMPDELVGPGTIEVGNGNIESFVIVFVEDTSAGGVGVRPDGRESGSCARD